MMNSFVESVEESERHRSRLLFVNLASVSAVVIHKEISRKKMGEGNRFTRKMDDCLKSIEGNICLPEFLKILEVGVMGWVDA